MNEELNAIVLEIKDIYRTYRIGRTNIPVLRGLNLEVYKGEWLCLLGASGSGKTTLLNLIGCLEKPDAGSIKYNGIDLAMLSRNNKTKLRSGGIGYVFQSYHLLPELTVLENVRLPAMIHGLNLKESKRKAELLLEQVGLKERVNHRPSELSGGEQQRAAIARALINDPDLILADEPTGNLDSKTGSGILDLFKELHNNNSKTIIMVTHNHDVAALANRVIKITDGVIEGNN